MERSARLLSNGVVSWQYETRFSAALRWNNENAIGPRTCALILRGEQSIMAEHKLSLEGGRIFSVPAGDMKNFALFVGRFLLLIPVVAAGSANEPDVS